MRQAAGMDSRINDYTIIETFLTRDGLGNPYLGMQIRHGRQTSLVEGAIDEIDNDR